MTSWILSSTVLIVSIIALRTLFKNRISPGLRYGLWLIVLIRLLIPFNIGNSSLSVLNVVPSNAFPNSSSANEVIITPFLTGEETTFEPFNANSENENELHPTDRATGTHTVTEKSRTNYLLLVYVLGALCTIVFVLFSNIHFASKLRRSRTETGTFMELRVYSSELIESPCLFGLLPPAIYLSADIDTSQEKYVLMHERAHYRQGDHIWAILRSLAIALHWYNPLVWYAAKLSKQDGELSCDQKVIDSMMSEERLKYGETLINLSCISQEPLLCAVTPLSSKGKALKERVEYVAKRPYMLLSNMAAFILFAIIVAGCTFTGADASQPEYTASSAETIATTDSNSELEEKDGSGQSDSNKDLPGRLSSAILDRNGNVLNEENFPLYSSAASTFEEYLNAGSTISLTIDLEFQQQAQKILQDNLANLGASGFSGCLVALDVKTGAPLAIVATGEAVNPLTISFTPNHVFLPCTAVAASGEKLITADDLITCNGVFDRYIDDGVAPECWIHRHGGLSHSDENMETALRDSCDYYFYALGNDCGIDAIERYAHSMGLGVPTGIELPSSNGLMPNRETAESYGASWNIGHTLEVAVGRSFCSFTPIQLAQYCATIANDGQRYSASIIHEVTDSEGNLIYGHSPVLLSHIESVAPEEWEAIQHGMYLSCYESEGMYLNNDFSSSTDSLGNWRISGKISGTNDNSLLNEHIFIGYAPYENPQIAVAVVTITAEENGPAGQIAKDVFAAYKALAD